MSFFPSKMEDKNVNQALYGELVTVEGGGYKEKL
jgi:hypothetical protein